MNQNDNISKKHTSAHGIRISINSYDTSSTYLSKLSECISSILSQSEGTFIRLQEINKSSRLMSVRNAQPGERSTIQINDIDFILFYESSKPISENITTIRVEY